MPALALLNESLGIDFIGRVRRQPGCGEPTLPRRRTPIAADNESWLHGVQMVSGESSAGYLAVQTYRFISAPVGPGFGSAGSPAFTTSFSPLLGLK